MPIEILEISACKLYSCTPTQLDQENIEKVFTHLEVYEELNKDKKEWIPKN